MSSIPAPRGSSRTPASYRLLLPIGPSVGAADVVAAAEVALRTAPAEAELSLLIVASADLATAAPDTWAALRALPGHVRVETGPLFRAAELTDDGVLTVVDVTARPDLAGLPDLVARLDREDDPLPFVHRLGLLVTRRDQLAGLAGTHLPEPTPLPDLARALRPRVVAPEFRPSIPSGPVGSPSRPGRISVVMVADASLDVLDASLGRVKQHLPSGAEVLIVDPGGDYGRSSALRTVRWAKVVPGSGIHPVSAGVRAATGEIVVLLDAGTWVVRRTFEGLVAALRSRPDVVAAGPTSNLAFGDQQAPGLSYRDVAGMERFAESRRSSVGSGASAVTDVGALAAGCLAIRRDAVLAVGGHDEAIADPEIAGLDLCLRLRANGGRLVRADGVFVHGAELPRGTTKGRWRFGGGGDLELLRARHGADADRALPGLVGTVMIVKNEEATLARALESVSGLVDDVVVCDTGSTDGTLALIEASGARITSFPWVDDFAAARNAALAVHTGTWALLLDADEELESAAPIAWRRWLAENPTDVVYLVCRNLDSGTAGSTVDNASYRLLRAGTCHWQGRIHEQMVRRDGEPANSSASDDARIIHHGYAVRMVLDRKKVDRNTGLTQLELDDSDATGSDGDPLAEPGRARFERGRSEMLADHPAEAEKHFRAAVELLPEHSEMLRRMAYCSLATLANEQGRYAEGLDFAERALDAACSYTQAAVAFAVAHLQLKDDGGREAARRVLEAAVRVGRELEGPRIDRLLLSLRDEGLVYGGAASLLGGLLLEADEAASAVDVLLPLAQTRPSLFSAWNVLKKALEARRSDWAEVLAATAATVPGALEPLVSGLDGDDRTELLAALRRHGVEDWQVSEVERTWQALQPELRRMSSAALVAAARQQEAESPELALRLWRFAGDAPHMRVGQARCLDAMGRLDAAVDALDEVDPTQLEPPDTLFVVALAAEVGDVPLALALLDGLPPELDESLAGPARQMRELLGAG